MGSRPSKSSKTLLDKDLDKLSRFEEATQHVARNYAPIGAGLLFILLSLVFAASNIGLQTGSFFIITAATIGAYMAINIGANDVANNIGPAVGAKALSLSSALIIAAIAETSGALLAGGSVVDTISRDIINASTFASPDILIGAMLSALLAAALWINISTSINAPVSTTHAVVGGVIGAGWMASGISAVDWASLSIVAAGWMTSPILSGLVAIVCLIAIEHLIINQDDKIEAARRWVPVLIGLMAAIFTAYMLWIGFRNIVHLPMWASNLFGVLCGIVSWRFAIPFIERQSRGLENRNGSLKLLFHFPLIIAATALSFAHGANDVSNAVGPVAAIVRASSAEAALSLSPAPIWVMLIGAFGLSVGILLFGPRLIRLVGDQITKLNPMRAFCVSIATALTVLMASAVGLPLSTTHTAVGAIFGIGFYREWRQHSAKRSAATDASGEPFELNQSEMRRRYLVRRSHFLTIIAAWLITVPISGCISALLYWIIFELFI